MQRHWPHVYHSNITANYTMAKKTVLVPYMTEEQDLGKKKKKKEKKKESTRTSGFSATNLRSRNSRRPYTFSEQGEKQKSRRRPFLVLTFNGTVVRGAGKQVLASNASLRTRKVPVWVHCENT